MSHNRFPIVGRTACAFALSCLMAVGPLADGLAAGAVRAYADEPSTEIAPAQPSGAEDAAGETTASEPDANPTADAKPGASGQLSQDVPLSQEPSADAGQAGQQPSEGAGAGDVATGPEGAAGSATAGDAAQPDRVSGDVPLSSGDTAAKAGAVVVDGLKYLVHPDGQTATLAGWFGTAPAGNIAVAARVVSGADAYRVTAVADRALAGCGELKTVVLPESVETVGEDAFEGCAKLESIEVAERNERFASYDGMLFEKDLSVLLKCPEAKISGGGGLSSSISR